LNRDRGRADGGRAVVVWLLAVAAGVAAWPPGAAAAEYAAPVHIDYAIVATYPHDRGAFTQGLVYAGGALYESTGLRGRSSVRRVDLLSGRTELLRPLAREYFAEGLTAFGDRLIQLTWRSGTGFVYARDDLRPLGEFHYATDGWGLTQDGRHLIMSDGSASLIFLDPDRFTEVRRIEVRDDHGPVERLNELEYVGGDIYANVWRSPRILRIDPASGRVTGVIDLSPLVERMQREPSTDVLNGIAYIPGSGRFLVTGKQWPSLFAITLSEPE
jgi:glutaminyl-peptide cyclotransferase